MFIRAFANTPTAILAVVAASALAMSTVAVDTFAGDAVAAAEIEPFAEPLDAPAADPFAGRTVANQAHGRAMMDARGRKVPKVGQRAPEFSLLTGDGKRTIRLADYRGKKPVVLLFGSLT